MFEKYKKEIIETSKKLKIIGFLPGFSGNISLKIGDKILITPSGIDKGELEAKDIAVIGLKGDLISGPKPSSESKMHLAIYNRRKDISAIVHTHPPAISALSCTKTKNLKPILAEFVVYFKNNIPFLPYRQPGSSALADIVGKNIYNVNAVVLKNHGLVTFSKNLTNAVALTEEAEHLAKVYILAKIAGDISPLSFGEIMKLKAVAQKFIF